jgi:death-on-curing protein
MESKELEPTWVPILVVLASQHEQLNEHGGLHELRDRSVLESALDRPRNRHAYDSTADLADLAAAYAFGIATSHPFNDGNKRAAFLTAAIFLELNGYDLSYPEPEVVRVMLAVAGKEMDELQLAQWIREGLQPLS